MILSFDFEERPSDSTFVDRLWYTQSESATPFTSLAVSNWQMVVTHMEGKTVLTVRGPETKATSAFRPPNAEHFGILFKLGTFMPLFPTPELVDNAINLPDAGDNTFWLNGSAWEYPDLDNADVFVERLVREGLLVNESVVAATLQGQLNDLSLRSVQRRFVNATGLTHGAIRQIERARQAAILLKQGTPALDAVYEAGYSDQPHLTRSLKQLIGHTPAQMNRESQPEHIGFLFEPALLNESSL